MANGTTIQLDILRALAGSATSYLEVGVQEGRSLRAVVTSNPSIERVTLCDTWGRTSGGSNRGSHEHIDAMLRALAFPLQRVTFLDGDSKGLLPRHGGVLYDLVHIDGGHDYLTALSDLIEGWRLCGRTMVVHDVSFPEVWRALWEFGQRLAMAEVRLYFGGHGTAVIERLTAVL